MSSKRQRGESSKSKKGKELAFNDPKFVSAAAKKRFELDARNERNFIPERGFAWETDDDEYEGITDVIDELEWRDFCKHPAPAVKAVVMEFYANVVEATNDTTMVRGKTIRFDPRTINDHYKLDQGAPSLAELDFDPQRAIQVVAERGAVWKRDRSRQVQSFKGVQLKLMARVWYYFVCAKLMPTSHFSDVDKDRCRALYSIMVQRNFNVGGLIRDQIHYCASHPNTNYYVPHLITAICRVSGVIMRTDELRLAPAPRLDQAYIDNLTMKRYRAEQQQEMAQPPAPQQSNVPFEKLTQKQQLSILHCKMNSLEEYNKQYTEWANKQAVYQSQLATATYEMMHATLQAQRLTLQPPPLPSFPGEFEFVQPTVDPDDMEGDED